MVAHGKPQPQHPPQYTPQYPQQLYQQQQPQPQSQQIAPTPMKYADLLPQLLKENLVQTKQRS